LGREWWEWLALLAAPTLMVLAGVGWGEVCVCVGWGLLPHSNLPGGPRGRGGGRG